LTDIGKVQAFRTGDFIRRKSLTFSHYFCSDLLRTRETFAALATGMKLNNPLINLIVLPCAHELGELQSDGQCDGRATWASENMMACSKQATQDPTNENCNHALMANFGYKIEYDWNYYFNFYHHQTRNSSDKHKFRRHCSAYPLSIINSVFDYFATVNLFAKTKTFFAPEERTVPSNETKYVELNFSPPKISPKKTAQIYNYNPFLVEPKTNPSSSPRILPTKSKTPFNNDFNPFLVEPKSKTPFNNDFNPFLVEPKTKSVNTTLQKKQNQLRLHAHLKRASELPTGNYENVNLRPEDIYEHTYRFKTAEQNTNPYRKGKRKTLYRQTLEGGKRKKKTRVRKTFKKRT
jgi:hypothetical protein